MEQIDGLLREAQRLPIADCQLAIGTWKSAIRRDASTSTPPRKLRVLDLINTDESAKELLRRRVTQVNATGRYENEICCGDGKYVPWLRARGHTLHVIDTPRGLSPGALLIAIGKTFRLLRRRRFDVIHTHGSVIGVIGRIAAFLARTPAVVHQVHGFHHHENMRPVPRRFFILVERLVGLLTDRLLFQNQADVEECLRRRIAPSRKLVLAGNGISLDEFHPSAELTNPRPVILCAARFEPVKNHPMLLEAAKILQSRQVDFTLRLAGDGELREVYERWVREQGLKNRVEFLGYVDGTASLTAQADVCVLVSLKEGWPRSVMEAAACGKPMVATKVIGNRDTIIEGVTGFLVPLQDAVALADRLQQLLQDADLRRVIGRNAVAYAREHFDEQTVTQRIIRVYDALTANDECRMTNEE